MVKFSKANTKIEALGSVRKLQKYLRDGRDIYSFDLISGHTCPFAVDCHAKVIINDDGRKQIVDGPDSEFRCFSASQEVAFPSTYNLRMNNFQAVRGLTHDEIVELVTAKLPADAGIIRIHVGGDFFSPVYFDAWITIAKNNPSILFYAYTKSLPYWVKRIDDIPENFVLTASRGGRRDDLIETYNLRSAVVVFSKKQAKLLGLKIDHNDSCAADVTHGKFALLIHGVQPAGSEASAAIKEMKRNGTKFAYGKK
jgi:hypothetical protein